MVYGTQNSEKKNAKPIAQKELIVRKNQKARNKNSKKRNKTITIDYREVFTKNIEKLTEEERQELKSIEEKELMYLTKYYHFLKYAETEILKGFRTKRKIEDDWKKYWGKKENGRPISDFAVGAERIVYALLNGKGVGVPNSCPVGSDLMFELDDAFIHIDLKSVGTDNVNDYKESIFIGENQNSYDGRIISTRGKGRNDPYYPHLPYEYKLIENDNDEIKKLCLSYFITILYDKDTLDTICLSLLCMPNGKLRKIYENAPLRAGKNKEKARFNFLNVGYFELMSENGRRYPRVKIIHLDKKRIEENGLSESLKYIIGLYNSVENDLSYNP